MGWLRNRLLLGSCAVIAFGMLVSNVAIYSNVRSTLYEEFDASLYGKALMFSTLTEYTDEGLEIDFDNDDFAEYKTVDNPSYLQVWRADGTVFRRSDSLNGANLERDSSGHAQDGAPTYAAVELPNGERGRQVALTFRPKIDDELLGIESADEDERENERGSIDLLPEVVNSADGRIDETLTLVVARSTAGIDLMVARLTWLLVIVATVSLGVSFALIYVVVWKSLLPLNRIAESIGSIDEERLDERVNDHNVPHEVAPVVTRLNGLLQRVASVVLRERAFSSEVAHELRTPLSGIRTTIEVCLTNPRESQEYKDALEICLKICGQSQRMVESLLAISRLENGKDHCESKVINLPNLFDECWQEFADHASSKSVKLELYSLEPVEVVSDREKLRVVFRNLLQNAVSHCDERGKLRIWSTCRNGSVDVAIENTGNKLSSSEIPAAFDRFWRGDASRSQTGDHFGLGLPLAKKLLAVLGGQIDVTVSDDSFRVHIVLPTHARPASSVLV